jgi:hypothetical protein
MIGTNINTTSQAMDFTGVLFSEITTITVPAINTPYIIYIMVLMFHEEKKSNRFCILYPFRGQKYNFSSKK